MRKTFVLGLMVCCFSIVVSAQVLPDEPLEDAMTEEVDNQLNEEKLAELQTDSIYGEQGSIRLASCHFCINVPKGYQYLDKAQSQHLLCDYWGNPQDDDVLGALVADSARIFWNVSTAYIIYYDDAGYVSDKDAADIDYDELLKDLQNSTAEANETRKREGYYEMELVDWAVAPQYDSNRKTLCWAKHLCVNGEEDVLNYDIRILGKEGYVIIQAVADLEECRQIIARQDALISSIQFDKGYTYADFDPKKDRIAEWTIGGLIAGKILAKAGILGKLSVFLLKFWKLILIGVMAVGAPLFKYFRKRRKETGKPEATEEGNSLE